MKEYSFTEARQHFASILDEARKEGVVYKKERWRVLLYQAGST